MTRKKTTERTQAFPAAKPDLRAVIQDGLKAATNMSPTGWLAIVSILVILLAAYAIHVVFAMAMRG